MAITSTFNFLPEYFRTVTNQRFTGATLDQLVSDAKNVQINGYIGRSFAPTYKLGDNYVPESTKARASYQLEPSVVITDKNKKVVLNSTYIDLLQSVANNGGFINNQQRLFGSEYYNYDGHFDYDKFVNYNNYYWIPGGPDSVGVSSSNVPLTETFVVTRNTSVSGYTFSGSGSYPNTQITLARGGTYQFTIDQPGFNFWIQSEPGVTGVDPNISTIDTRQVFGVTNNGTDNGVIQFKAPLATAQNFYTTMGKVDNADAAVTFNYVDIQNTLLSAFLKKFPDGLDGIVNQLHGKKIIFVNGNVDDDALWESSGLADAAPFDSNSFDRNLFMPGIVPSIDRTSVWQVNLVATDSGDYVIQISPITAVTTNQKVFVTSGKTYAATEFWVNNMSLYNVVPLITATQDYLYYQDSSNPGFVGQIKLVDNATTPINVPLDIIGKVGYKAPNGVVFTNGLKIQFDSLVVPSSYANSEFYVEGVGTGIQLVPVSQLVVPESFASAIATTPDYITINRASQDLNAWTRTNSWFHVDVLTATATYNNTAINYGPNIPGRRAIIEFESDLQLFNFGKQAKSNVDVITFGNTDAFVNIEGQTSYTLDGVALNQGMIVIFANDYDTNVKNEVWQIDYEVINNTNYLRLIKTTDDPVNAGQNVLITQGNFAGQTFWFDGTTWHSSQEKTGFNQTPLFDIVDTNGYSFADATVYPNSTFAGTAIFGYKVGTGNNDVVLGFPLSYQTFNNIGDIVFNNFYDTEAFTYTTNTTTGAASTLAINTGYILKNNSLVDNTKLTDWVTGIAPSEQYQIITKFFDGKVLTLNGTEYAFIQVDVTPDNQETIPYLKVYLNNTLLNPNAEYLQTTYGVYPIVVLTTMPAIGDKIDVAVFSNSSSNLGYYDVPDNLDSNPLNENFNSITLGQLRNHYSKLLENTRVSPSTPIPPRDRYVKAQGGTLLQHSSPTVYGMTFLTDPTVNFAHGITLARKEYTRFKNRFISLASSLKGIDYTNPASGVDDILASINSVKNSSFPWYYSDMVPQGTTYNSTVYTVLNARQTQYEINSIFNNTVLSNRAVLVYHNGVQLVSGKDFAFSLVSPAIKLTTTMTVGDTLEIRDYSNTDGNYIPETPTKLGLYPKFEPEIYLDNTYQIPTRVIRGHDGSLTPAFNDFRDAFLLELEKRIYNNIKADYKTNFIDTYNTIPGRFRLTDYSQLEWNQLLTQNFLQWVGDNHVDYTSNSWFDVNNPWTWNYDQFTDVVDGSFLQGSWRAVYNYWFDTDTPHLTPWEMLGFSEMPTWWTRRYGAAPYTGGNSTMWEDLEAGYNWNDGAPFNDARFTRPGLTKFVPVDSAGNLLPPTQIGLIKQFNSNNASNSFQVGQQGPVETAWRRSSDYAFAVQSAMAVARPAQYFATQIDISRFFVNSVTGQFSNTLNQKIAPTLLVANGDTTTVPGSILRTAGYLNWIGDYVKNLGMNPVSTIEGYLNNFEVKLAYKVAGFTDQKLINVSAEQTSPGSTNASIIIPDENYTVHISKPIPAGSIAYSGVIVTRTDVGYSVAGYDTTNPFFTIFPSIASNQFTTVTVGNLSVQLYDRGNPAAVVVPYGTNFTSAQQVSDFLVSYQRYLEQQGFVFDQFDTDLQLTRDWKLSVNEFLTWAQQGWANGTILVLNPTFNSISVISNRAVVDEVKNSPNTSRILDANFKPIKSTNFNILRSNDGSVKNGNRFSISTIDGLTGIAFAKLDLVQYESTLIFDNVDNFGDIIYIPNQGTRQFRLKISGAKTGLWDGALSPTGYIYINPNITPWQPGTDYKQGDIVTYNNGYYTAPLNIVASQTFNQSQWTHISLSDMQTGLLPSLGHNAQIFEHIYDVDNPPQDENFQIFSAGLIGFRERPFLSNLGLSIPTQTKFYQGYIKQKGTQNAIDALTKATFDNVKSTINTYEEWAFQVGTYGGVNGNNFSEFVLDQSVFQTNPVALTLTSNAAAYSTANIIVNLAVTGNTLTSNVYNASNLASTSTALYNNRNANVSYSSDLPTSGYVNLADVDFQIFDIATITTLPTLSSAQLIWTAKDFTGNWNVFRVSGTGLTATTLNYTLDSFGQLVFNTAHSLVAGQYIVLQGFDSTYNGLYQIVNAPDSSSVTITLADAGTALITAGGAITGQGSVFTLNSMVVPNDAAIGSSTPYGGWVAGDTQWVNYDVATGATGWSVYQYNGSSWIRIRQQAPQVDINTVNRSFLFNKSNNIILASLDFIDPAKGKVLSTVDIDIDFKLTSDPAFYNAGSGTTSEDFHWGPSQVGKIWWDLDAVRYIDYEQDALIYRLNNWAQPFPGSQIRVYEWVQSTVLPSQYVTNGGDGVPLFADDSAYSVSGFVDQNGAIQLGYYFWVIGKSSIAKGNSNSILNIATSIINPQAQGVPYATILRDDTIALYNVNGFLTGKNTVLHTSQVAANSNLIHSEYALVQEGNATSKLPIVIQNKIIDSLAGQDMAGNPVPDPTLSVAQSYGIQIRPRQSMFIDNQLALSNYLTYVNGILLAYPVLERKIMTTMNSQEAVPNTASSAYSLTVESLAELGYIDTTGLSTGYKILVNNDASQFGKWTIYTWDTPTTAQWNLSRVQNFKTNLYWTLADWFEVGYDPTVTPDVTVANNLELGKLTLKANTHVKVLNNGNNQFVVYFVDSNLTKNLVGIQNGTLQINTTSIPALELREILTAVSKDIFIDDLAMNNNELFFTMVKYALTEQKNIDWAFKTSFLSATQYIRALKHFPAYVADDQQYYLDYINEVKPYRTTVRQFVIDYQGDDQYAGDTTDFDLPPYWDTNLKVYRSPSGEQGYDANLLSATNSVYSQWYKNYAYKVINVVVTNSGTGYILAPEITIPSPNGTPAKAYATLDGNGGIASIVITDPGSNFTTIPTVIITGTGHGATAYAELDNVYDGNAMGHNVIRSISTKMKFDRVTYTQSNTFVFWNTITSANVGQVLTANTIVVNNGNPYVLTSNYTISSPVTFPSGNVAPLTASSFDNANDRIVAFNGNVDLTLTQKGLTYPGVILDGNTFTGNTFDTNIQSFYSNVLGVSPGEIIVDGGAYASTFSSYGPEELVPGRAFDTSDISVYDTSNLSFRLFKSIAGNTTAYRIAAAATTTLVSNLAVTDTTIVVADATKLPAASVALNQPGQVFINGEQISYWRNYALETQTPWVANLVVPVSTLINYLGNAYITTGNVYDIGGIFANVSANVSTVNLNTLGQIRREVDGTCGFVPDVFVWTGDVNTVVPKGTVIYYNGGITGITVNSILGNIRYEIAQANIAPIKVTDASIQQVIPNSYSTSSSLTANEIFKTSDVTAVSYGLEVTTPISANIGDILKQLGVGNTVISSMRVLQSVTNSKVVPVIITSGTVVGLPVLFDSVGLDYGGFTGSGTVTSFVANSTPYFYYGVGNIATFSNSNVSVTSLQIGGKYKISALGTTNWANVGAGFVANVAGNISNGNIITGLGFGATGNVLVANIGQYPDRGNLQVGTYITGGNIASGTYITAIGPACGTFRSYSINSNQYTGNIVITGQQPVGTVFTATAVGTGTGTAIPPNGAAVYGVGATSSNVFVFNGTVLQDFGTFTSNAAFDNVASPIVVSNSSGDITTGSYAISTYLLGNPANSAGFGLINTGGNITISSGTPVLKGNLWYSTGIGVPSNGFGLINSTTPQATFLANSQGFMPPAGTTP